MNMKSLLALFAATFFWGLNFHLAKVMLEDVGFMEAGFWRYLFGVAFLLLLLGKNSISLSTLWQHLEGISLVGVIGLFGFNLFFFWGLQHTTAVNAALIMSLNPAFTLLLSNRILKTQLPLRAVIGMLIALLGVVYLMAKGEVAHLQGIRFGLGDGLIMVANLLFALHHVWVKKYAHGLPVLQFTLLTSILCLLCFGGVISFLGFSQLSAYPLYFWLAALGMGGLGTALAYFLWNKGIGEAGAEKGGIFMNVVPLSTALLAIIFGEPLHTYHLVCGLLIISGVLLTMQPARTGKRKATAA